MENEKIKVFPFFVLRTPLYSINEIYNRIFSFDFIKEICQSDLFFREAIFLASPSTYYEMLKWLEGKLENDKNVSRLVNTILKYYLRMCSRCTPFGLFASISIGQISEVKNSKILLSEHETSKRHTRLDMYYLCSVVHELEKKNEIREKLKYFPNDSIYNFGNQLRYTEYKYKDGVRNCNNVAVEKSIYLQLIIDKANNGCCYSDLVEVLTNEGIDTENASDFIGELIDNKFIVSEIEPSVTGNDVLGHIINVLALINQPELCDRLTRIKLDLERIDNQEMFGSVEKYGEILNKVKKNGVAFEEKYLFQVDTVRPVNKQVIGPDVINSVIEGITYFLKIIIDTNKSSLTKFKDAFIKRYDKKEMQLLQVLDPECGIGYLQGMGSGSVNPLVDNLTLPSNNEEFEISWNKYESFIFTKLIEATKNKVYEVELTDKDILNKQPSYDLLAETFSAIIQVYQSNVDNKLPLINLKMVGNPSAVNLLGRFCYLNNDLYNNVLNIVSKEEDLSPDVLFAEIIHLPETRTGNILLRPILRKYEIPYLAGSRMSVDYQIKLNDLYISVKENKVILKSKRLNKQIIPRLSSAHIFTSNSLPVYQFLGELQLQDNFGGTGFSWGIMSKYYDFLPRVKYKNIIFSPALWKVKVSDMEPLMKIFEDTSLVEKLSEWRSEKGIPSKCFYRQYDNKLLINFEDVLILRMFFELIKKENIIELEEFLFDIDNSYVGNSKGSYTNEIILSFHKSQNKKNII